MTCSLESRLIALRRSVATGTFEPAVPRCAAALRHGERRVVVLTASSEEHQPSPFGLYQSALSELHPPVDRGLQAIGETGPATSQRRFVLGLLAQVQNRGENLL